MLKPLCFIPQKERIGFNVGSGICQLSLLSGKMHGWSLEKHRLGIAKSAFDYSSQRNCSPKDNDGPYERCSVYRYCNGGSEGL